MALPEPAATPSNPGELHETDVLIIGGGPGGATLAALLAQKGIDVTVIEKSCHPRFHVGESLLPMNLPIFERLGIAEQVRMLGVPKYGADFTLTDDPDGFQVYPFARALGNVPDHAYEVKRAEFDHLVFDHCRQVGARTLENTRVSNVDLNRQRPIVETVDQYNQREVWRCKLVVDASGRDAFLASKNGWREANKKHSTAAIFGHFSGVERRQGRDQGNISIYMFEHGWIWMIPLRNDVVSVGATCRPDYLKTRKTELKQFLLDTLNMAPAAMARMRRAASISPVRVAANYSYRARQLWGDNFIAIGDACAFVDPVFSSGVFLAMSNAEQVVAAVQCKLEGDLGGYRKECRAYTKKNRRGLSAFTWFIYRFTKPAMRFLFRNPRNILGTQNAVISLLAGDVFDNKAVRRRLLIFRVIYMFSWLAHLRPFGFRRGGAITGTESQSKVVTGPPGAI